MARTKSINFPNMQTELSALFDKLQRATVNSLLKVGSLAIHAATANAKTTATMYVMVDGVLISKAATDPLTTLVGTVTNAKFNVFVFSINVSGTVSVQMGTEAATLAGVVAPTVPDGQVAFGMVVVNPTGTGNFVGGTTALDDATVVPNAAFIDLAGEFFPQFATL
jgi:hypothetical protein